jgi:hypothetical protein
MNACKFKHGWTLKLSIFMLFQELLEYEIICSLVCL